MKPITQLTCIAVVAAGMLLLPQSSANADEFQPADRAAEEQPRSEKVGTTTITVGGYIKADAVVSKYGKGRITGGGEDFYIPRTLKTSGHTAHQTLNTHAKESRIWVKSQTPTARRQINTHLEIDFLLGLQGDERVGNSFSPRLRHAYFKWNNLLIGQSWFTFTTPNVIPELLDCLGPSGIVFGLQTQVRYTVPTAHGDWQFALENPETTLTPNNGGPRIDADDAWIPDAVIRYNWYGNRSNYSIAMLGRQLAHSSGDTIDTQNFGAAVSLSGKLQINAQDDFQFQVNFGNGLGRYLGLNSYNVGVINDSNQIDLITQYGGFAAYRHFWTDRLRSTIEYSLSGANADIAKTGPGEPRQFQDAHCNLLWSPVPSLTFGIEYYWAHRTDEGGSDGNLHRLQLAAKCLY